MDIPIFVGGERTGTLAITESGPRRELEARLRDEGRVVRLWVFGRSGSWYLGIPEPAGGELYLKRRPSPAQLRDFPREPLYAAERRREEKDERLPSDPERERRVFWLGGRPHYF
ncbi:MAG: hypothetical protein IKD79_04785 [Oscillospiraceae bacterium]|nr:hypothetical protein [Oscillospiraceae bacterium]